LNKRQRTNARVKAKRRKRAQGTRGIRVFIFTFSFILFVLLSLYGLSFIKKKISSEVVEKSFSSTDFAAFVEDVDRRIAEALFSLGISIRDVKSKNVYIKKEHRISWEFKNMKIDIPKRITQDRVQGTLRKSLFMPNVKQSLQKNKASILSKIEINDIPTHELHFNFLFDEPSREIKREDEGVLKTPGEQANIIQEEIPKRETERKIFSNKKPKVVIIVDDLGLNKEQIDELIQLPAPLNFAVLPNLPYSRYAAEMANRRGWDVILHLPMEPNDSSGYSRVDAGDGALLISASKKDILAKLDRNLASVPYIKGVNNHMGSKFTENGELMSLVLDRIQSEGLFFIDSRTSKNTTGYKLAKKLRIKTAQRDVFLDQGPKGVNYVRSQMEKLITISKERGYAVGICHPYPHTLVALSQMIPKVKDEVDIIPASWVVN